MADPSRIRTLVHEKLVGRMIDPAGFIGELLTLLQEPGDIRCTLAGETTLRFQVGGHRVEIELDAARAKLRMLCARLSVLCKPENGRAVSPYGGTGSIPRDAAPPCSVSFKNTPEEHQFTLALPVAIPSGIPNASAQ